MDQTIPVFISYAHADQARVLPLAKRLIDAGFDVFVDAWRIAAGDVVTGELEAGITHSDAGIVVFSTVSVARAWVLEEYYAVLFRAVTGRARFIPVLIDKVEPPPFAGNRQAVDLTGDEPSREAQFELLVAGLRKRPR